VRKAIATAEGITYVDMTDEEIAARQAEEQALAAVTALMVKAEAQRRIYARYPQWKQANMLARSVELNDIRFMNGGLDGY
jgi:hypothetical protein